MNRSFRQRYKRDLTTVDFSYSDMFAGKSSETESKIAEDSVERQRIQNRIRELKKCQSGTSIEKMIDEVVKIIESEFPDSEYRNFFRGWVEHAFREKKGQQSMCKQIEKDVRDKNEGR